MLQSLCKLQKVLEVTNKWTNQGPELKQIIKQTDNNLKKRLNGRLASRMNRESLDKWPRD